ncbi:pilin [Kitasatospora sp. NBC_01287]|uniref:pilin n=1 Tax=Kitasatospora sp. NBC_01287 TaxID=2903573 RepID=UPI0022547685|nr:pilin [Kitasatospora sp. NBC_01287]MCX4750601.1 pilin [Kitasatospora sp. NBC_01287]
MPLRRPTHPLASSAVVSALAVLLLLGPATAADAIAPLAVLAAPPTVDQLFANITTWITGIIATIATTFLTFGGLRYLLAGGDPGEVEKAKGALKGAGVGYMIAILAPVILDILKGLVGAK